MLGRRWPFGPPRRCLHETLPSNTLFLASHNRGVSLGTGRHPAPDRAGRTAHFDGNAPADATERGSPVDGACPTPGDVPVQSRRPVAGAVLHFDRAERPRLL